jgi:integrase
MRAKLTPAFIAKIVPPAKGRVIYWDEALPGFGLMVTAKGHMSYVVDYRAGGRKYRMHLKHGLTLTDARKEAKAVLGAVAKGGNPLAERRKAERAKSETLRAVIEEYLAQEGGKLRTTDERKAVLERLVFPALGNRQIEDISRTDIIRLLDRIVGENGAPMADHTLAFLRRAVNWYASRSDTFRSPIIAGMTRTSPTQRRRQRILSDIELRALWKAAEASQDVFSHFVRFLLLTAARRTEAADMPRSELSETGDQWIIVAERDKTGLATLIPLSPAAQSVLNTMARIGKAGFVFTTDGKRSISGFSNLKRSFDAKMLAELREDNPDATLANWRLHDLRRTARSLMSRAGVPADHAERCLGHVIGGVRGVYDMYEYRDEKRRVFEALAVLIDRIVHPVDNVVPLKAIDKAQTQA